MTFVLLVVLLMLLSSFRMCFSIDGVVDITINSSAPLCQNPESLSLRIQEEELNELFTLAAMSQEDCILDFESTNMVSCQNGVYSIKITMQTATMDIDVCRSITCLNSYDFQNSTFANETVEMLMVSNSYCSNSGVTSDPLDNSSDALMIFVRDLIIVGTCSGGGGALCVSIFVMIFLCLKYCVISRRKRRTWTLSGSDDENFAPYNPETDNVMSPINKPGREGPLPTPPPPDVATIPSLAPPPPPNLPGPPPPPPPPLPPVSGTSTTMPKQQHTSSSVIKTKTLPIPSRGTNIPHPPPPPPPPPSLPPAAEMNQIISDFSDMVADDDLPSGFVEDIYDTSISYPPDQDLHQKTKEMEDLLANMEYTTKEEGDVDEYVDLNPRSSMNQVIGDYVNVGGHQNRRVSFDLPDNMNDEYVEMSSSARQRDQKMVKFTSSEDMYI